MTISDTTIQAINLTRGDIVLYDEMPHTVQRIMWESQGRITLRLEVPGHKARNVIVPADLHLQIVHPW